MLNDTSRYRKLGRSPGSVKSAEYLTLGSSPENLAASAPAAFGNVQNEEDTQPLHEQPSVVIPKKILIACDIAVFISQVGYAFFLNDVNTIALTYFGFSREGIKTAAPVVAIGTAISALVTPLPVLDLEKIGEHLSALYLDFRNKSTKGKILSAVFLFWCELSFAFEKLGAALGFLKQGWGANIEKMIMAFSFITQLLLANMLGGGHAPLGAAQDFLVLVEEKRFPVVNGATVFHCFLLVFSSACNATISVYNVVEMAHFLPFLKAVYWKWIAGIAGFFSMALCISYPTLKRVAEAEEPQGNRFHKAIGKIFHALGCETPHSPFEKIGLGFALVNYITQVISMYTYSQVFSGMLKSEEDVLILSWLCVGLSFVHYWQLAALTATDNADGIKYSYLNAIQPYLCCPRRTN